MPLYWKLGDVPGYPLTDQTAFGIGNSPRERAQKAQGQAKAKPTSRKPARGRR